MRIFTLARGSAAATLGIAIMATVPVSPLRSSAAAAPARQAPNADARLRAAWHDAIARTPVPREGCFEADYPGKAWQQVACTAAPARPYVPAHGRRGYTVGNGNDYLAVVSGLIRSAVGSFPGVTGLKKETGYGGQASAYSLQLNSEFFKTSVCNGATNPSSCLGWQQFVFSNTSRAAFMQYWLIDYGSHCPSGGWMSYSGSCYRNSNAVGVPSQAITQLANLKITGSAVAGGTDTFVFATAGSAYSTTGQDSVVNLASAWDANEFNVVGDGGGSNAKFNKGTSLTVEIAMNNGSTAAPACKSDSGTTGETNNLTLGSCSIFGGSTPSVTFTEKR